MLAAAAPSQAPRDLRTVLAQLLALLPSPVTPPSPEAMVAREACCALDTIQQDMERLPQGTRRLAVQLRLNLAPEWIWSVLTDYDHLDRFIPNLSSSRQLWRRGNQVALEQVGTQQFCGLRFSARVQLELNEEPEQGRLAFRMLEGDFRCFQGLWQVASTTPAACSSTTSRCRANRACQSV